MGLKRKILFMFHCVLFIELIQADCETYFDNPTDIVFNDSTLFEKGDEVRDFYSELGNETLMFLDNGCERALEINGTKLLLKVNLLDPSACDIKSIGCVFRCEVCIYKNIGRLWATLKVWRITLKSFP
ncbi:uncharacterized protein LOC133204335 [Saccostrea echinata]|uniref:uncharacterized protein LOC133204335 n=1 Tax=Saccostrea echinata TaxID=191078 RepID=UPI002A829FC3|nr:uncharacterized protein LOC133204335 [Saccostrea echinata]